MKFWRPKIANFRTKYGRNVDLTSSSLQRVIEKFRKAGLFGDAEHAECPITIHSNDNLEYDIYAYKAQLRQELKPNDRAQWKVFVQWIIEHQQVDADFSSKIILSDGAHLHLDHFANRHHWTILLRKWGWWSNDCYWCSTSRYSNPTLST